MIQPSLHQVSHPDVVGATLNVVVDAHPNAADLVQQAILAEARRLQHVFDPEDPGSEFSRWRRAEGPEGHVSPELTNLLAASERFWVFSNGAFHPGAEPLVRRWREAAACGLVPDPAELEDLAGSLELPYTTVAGPVQRTGDCTHVDLGSLARGFILDGALEAGWRLGLASAIWLTAGRNQRHRGTGGVRACLQDVLSGLADSPLLDLKLRDAALSLSRRGTCGFRVGARTFGDVIDPRSGWPNEDVVGVAALAPDAMTADALATVVGVGRTGRRGGLPGCAWLAVHADGSVERSENWPHVGRTETLGRCASVAENAAADSA